LRAGIVPNEEPERTTDDALAGDPLPNVTQHVLRAEDVAQLLGLSPDPPKNRVFGKPGPA